jgi:hypothetical protein
MRQSFSSASYAARDSPCAANTTLECVVTKAPAEAASPFRLDTLPFKPDVVWKSSRATRQMYQDLPRSRGMFRLQVILLERALFCFVALNEYCDRGASVIGFVAFSHFVVTVGCR